ncbi:hypothetical protein, partial [Dermatophilus congolensis]
RDGAEIVSFARALHPEDPTPITPITHAIRRHHPHAHHAEWTARTLVHFILGYVAEEQNRSELTRAGLTQPTPPTQPTDAAFTFGVEAILCGSLHNNPT